MTDSTPLLPRPMDVGELLDHSIALYRRNFLTLIGIAAIIYVPFLVLLVGAAVLSLPLSFTDLTRRSPAFNFDALLPIILIALVPLSILFVIGIIFQEGALAYVVSESFLGRKIGIKAAYARAFHRGLPLFGGMFLAGLANVAVFGTLCVPYIGLFFASAGNGSSSANAAQGIVFLCICAALLPAIILAIILNIHWIFIPQAIVLEEKGATAGLGRSWRLVRGSFWRVLLIAFLLSIFVEMVVWGPNFVGQLVGQILIVVSPALSVAFTSGINILITTFATPFRFALLTVLYYDLRIRTEGFDLELQAQQLAEPTA